MSATLHTPAPPGTPPPPSPATPARRRRLLTTRHGVELAVVLALLAVAALLRFWDLHSRPGTEWDEPVYADVARSLAHGHGLEAKVPWGHVSQPYLFHPPFYFVLLGGWMRLVGSDTIGDARTLAALASLVVLALTWALVRPRWGALGAAAATLALATDGWLIFTNRVGWIENTMLVLLVGGLLAYDRALRRDARARDATRLFALAGVLLAAAVAYKHIAVYGFGVVALHWALTRRARRGHLVLLGAAGALLAADLAVMLLAFRSHGHNWFLDDTRVQLQRVLGHKSSRGSIGSWHDALDALVGPYKLFVATLALSAAGAALVLWRTAAGLRRRDLARRVADPLLYAWALAALLFLAALRLKMAHYFVLVEVPLLLYAFAELAAWARRRPAPAARRVIACLLLALLAVNAWTFDQRFVQRSDDALGATRAFARTLPRDATFLTEESIGTMIPQPYCKLYEAGACVGDVAYLAIYRSQTQRPPRNATLERLLRYSPPLARFDGFKERITLYRAAGPGPICTPARLGLGVCRLDASVRRWIGAAGGRAFVARVGFGDWRALRELRRTRPLAPLRDAHGRPWALLLGVGRDGRVAFANLGAARVGGGRCWPSRARCEVIRLRPGAAAHLELPRIDGRRTPIELKLRSLVRVRMRASAAPDARGGALLRAATTPRSLLLTTPSPEDIR
ncbi:MAG: glycosyltransferase family 39 protein [Actinobacteria bacterium]|nr:glycosyltransferase family 39 protein [Actinomycetota bacterium]